jgi:serine/threonine protein kinase
MKLLLILVLLFLFLSKPIWVVSTVTKQQTLVSVPVPSISPISTAMPAFSPGIQVGIEEHHKKMDTHKKMLIALVVASTALAAIIWSFFCFRIFHRKFSHKSHKRSAQSSDAEKGLAIAPFFSKFDSIKMVGKKGSVPLIEYKLLEKASDNFRDSNILGEGGFGCVYKARLDDNLYVAVKKQNCENHEAEKEFENEIDLLSRIQHPNIISLLGCSIHCESRFIVYELMQNGSLETQLHGPSHGSVLTWHMRMKIALDTARGLEYLHEHCNPSVIHRDLKTSNILLDSNFNAKVKII